MISCDSGSILCQPFRVRIQLYRSRGLHRSRGILLSVDGTTNFAGFSLRRTSALKRSSQWRRTTQLLLQTRASRSRGLHRHPIYSRLGEIELELIAAKGTTHEKRQKAQRLYAERAASDRCFHHGAWDWNIIMKVRAEQAKKEEEG